MIFSLSIFIYGGAVVVAQVVERARFESRDGMALFGNAINLFSLGVGLSLKNGS